MSRRLLYSCAAVAVVAAAIFLWYRYGRGALNDSLPAGALDDYLPRDTAAVIGLDLKGLRDNGLLEKPLGKALHDALTKEDLGLPFGLLGVEPVADIDGVRLAFSAGDQSRPLVLLRGRFDRARFRTGPGQLEELRQDGFRLYRHKDAGRDTTLALAGDTLVVSLVRSRVLAALSHAAGAGPVALDDGRLKEVLATVDRKQAIWLAADLVKLGLPQLSFGTAELRPVFELAASAQGGMNYGDELRVELIFQGRGTAESNKLEEHLRGVVKVLVLVRDVQIPLPIPAEWRPLFMLFADAEIERHGDTVTLHARQ
jgi:hypothetical protein